MSGKRIRTAAGPVPRLSRTLLVRLSEDLRKLPDPQLVRDAPLLASPVARILLDEECHVRVPALLDGVLKPRQVHHLILIVRPRRAAHNDPVEADAPVSA